MQSYDLLEFETARKKIESAIDEAVRSDVGGMALAQAYVYLAVVYFSGLDEPDLAEKALESAVAIDESVTIDLSYRTEELMELLSRVKGEAEDEGYEEDEEDEGYEEDEEDEGYEEDEEDDFPSRPRRDGLGLSGLGGEFVYEGNKGKTFFASFAVGLGGGYVSGQTERLESDIACCLAWAPVQVVPELGYYLSQQTTVSGAIRLGFPVGANVSGHASQAPALLGRLRHSLEVTRLGWEFSGTLGLGVIRNVVKIENGRRGMDVDTAGTGPLLIGGGMGYVWQLVRSLTLVGEVNGYLGINSGVGNLVGFSPGFGIQLDFNVGARMSF